MKKKTIKTNKAKKPAALIAALLLSVISAMPLVAAHCPLCTGATIVGVSITRALGFDDSIVGVFVGGMIISTALWTNKILKNKGAKGNNALRLGSLIALTAVLTLITFYYAGLFGRGNSFRIFGVESILVGSVSGGLISLVAFYYSNYLKNKNGGRVLFKYQTMIISLATLVANAAVFAFVL